MRLYIPRSQEENNQVAAWAGAELGVSFSPPIIALASLDERGSIIGAVIFNHFDGWDVCLSVVGRGSFSAPMVRQVCEYVFNGLGCARLTCITKRSNHQVRKLLKKRLRFEAMLPKKFGDEDGFQFGMCRDECKYLRKKHDAINASSSA